VIADAFLGWPNSYPYHRGCGAGHLTRLFDERSFEPGLPESDEMDLTEDTHTTFYAHDAGTQPPSPPGRGLG
jgi:hypothetical protein